MAITALAQFSNWVKERWMNQLPKKQFLQRTQAYNLVASRGQNMERFKDDTYSKLKVPIYSKITGGAGKPTAAGLMPARNNDMNAKNFSLDMAIYWIVLDAEHTLLANSSDRIIGQKMLTQLQNRQKGLEDLLGSAFLTDGFGTIDTLTGTVVSAGGTTYTIPITDVYNVADGETIELQTSAHAKIAADILVTGRSTQGGPGTLTVTSAVDITAGVSGSTLNINNSSVNSVHPHGFNEIIGFDNTYPTSNENGLDRTTAANAFWRAHRVDAQGDNIGDMTTFDMFQQMFTRLRLNGNKQMVFDEARSKHIMKATQFVYMDPNVLSDLLDDARDNVRITVGRVEDLDIEVQTMNGVPLIADDKVKNKAFFLNLDAWMYASRELFWIQSGGKDGFFHTVSDANYAQAKAFMAAQIHCEEPFRQGKIDNFNLTSTDATTSIFSN